jgi:hypothetical protein
MSELLFVTSVITPYSRSITTLRDEKIRLENTKNAIFLSLKENLFSKLVIVDGSNFDILNKSEIIQIEKKGIQVEQLKFQQSITDVQNNGSSFGEMTIKEYMIKNSNLVSEHGTFCKLSGRYNLINAKKIIPKLRNYDTFFVNYHPFLIRNFFPFTSTIFYKSSVDFFEKYLIDCKKECSYEVDGFLESVFYRRLESVKKRYLSFPYPYFSGISGVTSKETVNNHLLIRRFLSASGFLSFTCDE